MLRIKWERKVTKMFCISITQIAHMSSVNIYSLRDCDFVLSLVWGE